MGNCVAVPVAVDEPTSPTPIASTSPNITTGRGMQTLQPMFAHADEPVMTEKHEDKAEASKAPLSSSVGDLRGPLSSLLSLNVRSVKGLNFVSPYVHRPHGLAGIISVLMGIYFTIQTLLGYRTTPGVPNRYVTLYSVSGTIGCLGALGLIKKAPSSARLFFQMGALLQIGMLYFTYRFDSFPFFIHAAVPTLVAHCTDIIMAGLMVSTVLVLLKATVQDTSRVYSSTGLKIATCCGIAAIGSLCGYPVQLAVLGGSWLEKVYRWYPLQQVAFPYYVYIPATMGFNVIFFSATLHLRKLVSTKTFVLIILGFVFGTLIPTVVLQEIYIPKVSTQKLLIFNPPVTTRWWPRFDL